jgi:hypothetical protein
VLNLEVKRLAWVTPFIREVWWEITSATQRHYDDVFTRGDARGRP